MRLFVGFVMQGHIYSNTAVYGEKWVWSFWSLAYFRFFEALKFFKVKSLLNDTIKLRLCITFVFKLD